VWYDKRLFAGDNWWEEIQYRIQDWCDGFIYLLSPESVASEYCNKEYNIARKKKKLIFPVLIQQRTEVPKELGITQWADLSMGLENITELLNGLTHAERKLARSNVRPLTSTEAKKIDPTQPPATSDSPMDLLQQASEYFDNEHFDQALFLLEQLRKRKDIPQSICNMVEKMIAEAEAGVEKITYLREAEHEYLPIAMLAQKDNMRAVACEAFAEFRKRFPDYDPENLALLCGNTSHESQDIIENIDISSILPPPFEWVEIPEGMVFIEDASDEHGTSGGEVAVPRFLISKYPISNAQYEVFLQEGYSDPQWWRFSPEAERWHANNPTPKRPIYRDAKLPRTDVNWYEAMAFCEWLSHKIGQKVCLPSAAQWQRAAQGDDGRRYPWGNEFDVKRCNTNLSKIRQPTPVDQYPNGASPFGVLDMAGNVFEWCLTDWESGQDRFEGNKRRELRGGSWFNDPSETVVSARNWLFPDLRSSDRGFRIVLNI
ncbi:MAG: hypothetical protein CUN55_08140, partial [Phototrophicales bacterium]